VANRKLPILLRQIARDIRVAAEENVDA